MDTDSQNIALDMSSSEATMEIVLKNIYTSCDPNNSNLVPTSELIEFIRPYMIEDLSALENLRNMLDPEHKNISVASEKFYNAMNEWTQKITSHNGDEGNEEFNRTPSQLNVLDEKSLPYSQSTPRPSFGQKLLSCEGLLNLSNVSSYNLSPNKQAKDISIGGPEKTMLEEEVKQLQYQLSKVIAEMDMLKVQLAFSEEQNELLQDDLERFKTRLQSEQQVNDHLQENRNCLEDLREEINLGKKRIEELNKKLIFYEKENAHLNMYVQRLEKENSELEERCRQLSKTEQNMKKEFFDLRTELDMKEHEIASISRINEELKIKLCQKMTELEQLLNENELLDYKQQGLEKMLSNKRYSLSSHYRTCLDEMNSSLTRGSTIPIYSSPLKNKSFSNNNSPPLIKKILSPTHKTLYQVLNCSTPKNGLRMRKAFSLNTMSTRSLPNIFCPERFNVFQDQGDIENDSQPLTPGGGPYESLQTELFLVDPQFDHKDKNGTDFEYDEQINYLKIENESLQKKLEKIEEDNKILIEESTYIQVKSTELEKKLNNLMLEKTNPEETKTDRTPNELKEGQLKIDFNNLQLELKEKEQEILKLKNKFDFETVYKHLEIEYGKKVAQIKELQQNLEDAQNVIRNLTNTNQDLEKSINRHNAELEETKEKLKHNEFLNHNIEQTANKVQAHVDGKLSVISELQTLNEKFKSKIEKLEKDLQDKIKQINQLRDIFRNDTEIKNNMWSENENLRSDLNVLTQDCRNMIQKVMESDQNMQEMKAKHDELIVKYNEATSKNSQLTNEITAINKDISDIKAKCDELSVNYNGELTKNMQLLEQISVLKKEAEIKTEYDELKMSYNEATARNSELCDQISTNNKDISDLKAKCDEIGVKHKEELTKNMKLLEQIAVLKKETKHIKDSQEICKQEIMQKLVDYENSLQTLYSKIKDLECENDILKTDLDIEKRKSITKFAEDKADFDCEDSGVKSELDSDKKYSDGDASSSECSQTTENYKKNAFTPKSRSFEKQKLTIEKLREELRQEKVKCDLLRDRLDSKANELEKASSLEKQNLRVIISDLNDRLKQQEEYYKQLCHSSNNKIEDLSLSLSSLSEKHRDTQISLSEKDALLKRHFETQEYNKSIIDKLDKDFKDCKNIQNALQTDLNVKELIIKNISVDNQNLKQFARCSENKLVELSAKIKNQEIALRNYQQELQNKNEEISNLSSVLSERENKIQSLSTAAAAHEIRMSNILLELEEKDEACSNLERELKVVNESLSKTIDSQQNAFVNAEEKTAIDTFDSDSEDVKDDVKYDTILGKISSFTEVITECCNELNRCFTKFIEQWRKKIESHPSFKQLPSIKLCQSLDIEDILSVIVENIKAVILLLYIVSSQNTMDDNPESQINFLKNQQNTESSEPKTIKKFTLRPPKLNINRSTSQDSPRNVSQLDAESEEFGNENTSPDSQDFRTSFDNVEGENVCCYTTTHLQPLTFELQLHDAFPHVSDDILEKLGLHDTSPKVKLTKEQTEEVFLAFAIQGGLDSKNIKERLHKQKDACLQKYRKYQYVLKDISLRLREHHCIGATDPINPVFVLLEDVRFMMQDLMQSTGQLGILTCEHRMTKCWNLVTNYMAILKQDLEIAREQSSPKRNCMSSLAHGVIWVSFVSLLFFIGLICVHWQCKMTTDYKICPLDDFIKIISQRVGNPPY